MATTRGMSHSPGRKMRPEGSHGRLRFSRRGRRRWRSSVGSRPTLPSLPQICRAPHPSKSSVNDYCPVSCLYWVAASQDFIALRKGVVCSHESPPTDSPRAPIPPTDYLRVTSGLGSASPVQAVTSPLLSKETLLGVLEIASFQEFNAMQKTLLEELLPVVGMSMEILEGNLETQELLRQTQEQSRQLEEQTEELTQSQDELLAQKEELLAQQSELTAQRERLRETEQFFRSVLELAPDGLMVV